MTSARNPFRFVLPLRHIATVRTVQLLWRNSQGKEEIKNFYKTANLMICPTPLPDDSMIRHLEKSIERLSVPSVIKHELKAYVQQMVWDAMFWLHTAVETMQLKYKLDDNSMKKLFYFIDNLSWNDRGYVDGRAMLKAYVSIKETVDFATWCQLCHYCIEDDIVRLSRSVDFKKCKRFSGDPYSIYWYWKLYGKFPKKKRFLSKGEYSTFKGHCWEGLYDENNINLNLLKYSASYKSNIAAVKYFRSELRDYEEFEDFFSDNHEWINWREESPFYLLGQMRDGILRTSIDTLHDIFVYLLEWPWVLFIDHWIEEFGNVSAAHFVSLFGYYPNLAGSGREGFRKRQSEGLYYSVVYDPFRKLWRLFYRRFGGDDEVVAAGFESAFRRRDIVLCRIMLEGLESSQRIVIFRKVADLYQYDPKWSLKDDFSKEFVENVLRNEGERKICFGIQ